MKLEKRSTLLALSVLVVTLGSSCAPLQPSATVTSGGGPGMAGAQTVPYNGPKARITISRFVDQTATGDGEIGAGLTDMMTTALISTNRFIVAERGEALRERDLAASGGVKKGTEVRIGEIEGAELLVVGAITEFEPNAGGTAHIALDIRIIDARTSRMLAAHSVEGTSQDIGGPAGLAVGPLARGFGAFAKAPMEKAIRVGLQNAVNFIAQQTPAQYYHY